jgi:sodium-dependent dicarboxylate transporter 2/3/5
MISGTLGASCGFMLPVATPPNAIVFSSGWITAPQMARAGLALDLMGVALITLVIYLLAVPVFGITLGQLPAWAQ